MRRGKLRGSKVFGIEEFGGRGKECENLMIFDRWIFGDDYFFWDFTDGRRVGKGSVVI